MTKLSHRILQQVSIEQPQQFTDSHGGGGGVSPEVSPTTNHPTTNQGTMEVVRCHRHASNNLDLKNRHSSF